MEMSEKALYERDAREIFAEFEFSCLVWGEDLWNAIVIPYAGSIRNITRYKANKGRWKAAGLVYFKNSSIDSIHAIKVWYDESNNDIYICENSFTAVWKYLRKSVAYGIRCQQSQGQIRPKRPEDIVDLQFLHRERSVAIIDNGSIRYVEKKLPDEVRKAQGKKQSALDNPQNRYFFANGSNVYHDKDCEQIKMIPPNEFRASVERPENRKPCRRCLRKICLREACSPYTKQMPFVDRMLNRYNIGNGFLSTVTLDYGFKFQIHEDNSLMVKAGDDTWIIKGFNQGKLSLWHNNYVRTSLWERCITQGFHNQGVTGRNLYSIFEYINNYSFENHLATTCHDRGTLRRLLAYSKAIRQMYSGAKRVGIEA